MNEHESHAERAERLLPRFSASSDQIAASPGTKKAAAYLGEHLPGAYHFTKVLTMMVESARRASRESPGAGSAEDQIVILRRMIAQILALAWECGLTTRDLAADRDDTVLKEQVALFDWLDTTFSDVEGK